MAKRDVLRAVVVLLFGGILLWGLFQQAGKEPQIYYRLFLLLIPLMLLASLGLPWASLRKTQRVVLLGVGLLLLARPALEPTLTGRGFVILSLGWMALSLTLLVTARRIDWVRIVFMALILIGSVEALYGLIDVLSSEGAAAHGTFTNRNHFGGLLNMVIPLSLGGLFATYAGRKSRPLSEIYARAWVILLACAFMGLGIILSLSRAASLILVLTLVLLSILLALNGPRSGRRSLSGAAAWILIVLVVGLGSAMGLDALMERFEDIGEIGPDRGLVYQDTLRLIGDHPLTGVGPGMYEWRFRPYQTRDAGEWWRHAHNDYLETAAEWGVPAALIFWGFILWRFGRAVRLFFESTDPWQQGIALGCAGAVFSILLHSLVDFNLQMPASLMVFCAVLGLSWTADSSTWGTIRGGGRRR